MFIIQIDSYNLKGKAIRMMKITYVLLLTQFLSTSEVKYALPVFFFRNFSGHSL